jgi:MoaA/NifB/PqqE/SkfB family radical SAM enzyme
MNLIDVEKYLSGGIEALIRDIIKAAFGNPAGSAFFAKYALSAKKAERRRHQLEEAGEHIPSFLIASITENCNLQCAGCYDRANHACSSRAEMSREEWGRVFGEAEDIGISAILLAGGEPVTRMDVLEEAARHTSILFPVFTNGTMLGGDVLRLFEKSRNLIPIISVEGGKELTDSRRGKGVYIKTGEAMRELQKKKLLFGVSITVTTGNITEVTDAGFIAHLRDKGCRAAVFVEYVPVENPGLALADTERGYLADRVQALREESEMIIISFPGDEAESGGCLAAGRGFFHINAVGGAEPCPFSPYSDTSLKTTPLRDALKSPLFTKLRNGEALFREHKGGCVLFDQSDLVESLAVKA